MILAHSFVHKQLLFVCELRCSRFGWQSYYGSRFAASRGKHIRGKEQPAARMLEGLTTPEWFNDAPTRGLPSDGYITTLNNTASPSSPHKIAPIRRSPNHSPPLIHTHTHIPHYIFLWPLTQHPFTSTHIPTPSSPKPSLHRLACNCGIELARDQLSRYRSIRIL